MEEIVVGSIVTLKHDPHLYMTVIQVDGDQTICEYNDVDGRKRQNYPIATLDLFEENQEDYEAERAQKFSDSGFI